MYADRRSSGRRIDPRSATIALLLNGAALTGLIFAAPEVTDIHRPRPPIQIIDIPIAPPPKPLPPPKPVPHSKIPPEHPMTPDPVIQIPHPVDPGPVVTFTPTPIPLGPSDGTGLATGTATPTPVPTPALIGATVDPRYAADLQPAYPSEETRAGREGRVVVRVLIGIDGRVKQVEQTSATSDAFWRATQRQALARWRFRPATQGGVPVEAWRTMAIRFVLRE